MTGEGPYDIQGQYYATYTRAAVDHTPLMRYIDSEQPIVCAVTDHFDRNRVNMCLMNRYIVSYEPRNFKGGLGGSREAPCANRRLRMRRHRPAVSLCRVRPLSAGRAVQILWLPMLKAKSRSSWRVAWRQ